MNEAVIALGALVAMEPISAGVHRFIGHGVAWKLHRSHHEAPIDRIVGLEANDAIPAGSAVVTMAMFAIGRWVNGFAILQPLAIGMTMYGVAYFVVHDVYIHRRVALLPRHVGLLEPFRLHHLGHHRDGSGRWGIFWLRPRLDAVRAGSCNPDRT